jgi:hypothetical protein
MYFWMVVWSLRKRMVMEIAIGYDDRVQVVSREDAQKQMAMAVFVQHEKLRN